MSHSLNIERSILSIRICDSGIPIDVTKVALDHIEVAVHQDDISGVSNAKQPESSWHRVRAATCQLCLVIIESGLFAT